MKTRNHRRSDDSQSWRQGCLNTTQWVGTYSAEETFDIGQDFGTPASGAYRGPNRFSGTIEKVVIDTRPADLTAADRRKLRAAAIARE